MQRMHVLVKGKVQGVFFRASMHREAAALGITGWVKNLPDGSVEAIMEGSERNLAAMLSWSRQGPPGAAVRQVEVSEEPYMGHYRDFSIRY